MDHGFFKTEDHIKFYVFCPSPIYNPPGSSLSFAQATCNLPFRSLQFQAYQVEQDLRWYEALRSRTVARRRWLCGLCQGRA